MGEAYIIDAVRTPRGRGKAGKGGLSGIHPQELLAQTFNKLAERTELDKGHVDDVIIGCVSQAGEQGACIARNALLSADWPLEVTGATVNRFCGSGLQAASFAAMGVMAGVQRLTIGGGVESMSRVPMGSDGGGIDGSNLRLRRKHFQVPQGISADLIATIHGFSRQDVDRFALESQQRAEVAQKEGWFDRGIFRVRSPETGDVVLEADEHPRHGATLEKLAELDPVFEKMGATAVGPNGETFDDIVRARYQDAGPIQHVHTAGNSSGIVDGAAVVLFASPAYAKEHELEPRARVRAMATHGAEPLIMLTAPAPASRKALDMAGMSVEDIDLWEINEAFGVVPLQTMRELGVERDRVNVAGGAIALGHPLGATGAVLLGTALDELERRDLTTALITLCIGGGMGIAMIIERV